MVQPLTPTETAMKEASNAPLAHMPFDMPLPDDFIEDAEPGEVEIPSPFLVGLRLFREWETRLEMWHRRYVHALVQLRDIRRMAQLEYEEQVKGNLEVARDRWRRLARILAVFKPKDVNLQGAVRSRGANLLTEIVEVEDEEVIEVEDEEIIEDVESVEDISDGVEDVESTEEIE